MKKDLVWGFVFLFCLFFKVLSPPKQLSLLLVGFFFLPFLKFKQFTHLFSPPLLGLQFHVTNSAAVPPSGIPFRLPLPRGVPSPPRAAAVVRGISLTGELIRYNKKHAGH